MDAQDRQRLNDLEFKVQGMGQQASDAAKQIEELKGQVKALTEELRRIFHEEPNQGQPRQPREISKFVLHGGGLTTEHHYH